MEETTIIWSIVFSCQTAHFPASYYKNVYICVHAQATQNAKNFLYLWPTILKHLYGSCVNWKQEMWSDVFFSTVYSLIDCCICIHVTNYFFLLFVAHIINISLNFTINANCDKSIKPTLDIDFSIFCHLSFLVKDKLYCG